MPSIPPFMIGLAVRRPRPGAMTYPSAASLESVSRRRRAAGSEDQDADRARVLLALVETSSDQMTDQLLEEMLTLLREAGWDDPARQEQAMSAALLRAEAFPDSEATLVAIDWPQAIIAAAGRQRAVLVRERSWSLLSSDRDPRPVGRRMLLRPGDWIALLARGTAEALPPGSSASAALRLNDPFKVCDELVAHAAARNPLDHHCAVMLMAGID